MKCSSRLTFGRESCDDAVVFHDHGDQKRNSGLSLGAIVSKRVFAITLRLPFYLRSVVYNFGGILPPRTPLERADTGRLAALRKFRNTGRNDFFRSLFRPPEKKREEGCEEEEMLFSFCRSSLPAVWLGFGLWQP